MAKESTVLNSVQPITAPPLPEVPERPIPRLVNFVVDRETTVQAEVLNSHSDGSLDLKGPFRQPFYKKVDDLNPETGEPTGFKLDELTSDPTVEVSLRVRRADDDDVRKGRPQPGTWFEIS